MSSMTTGTYYASEQVLEIAEPSHLNMKDLIVKYSLNQKWKNTYIQLRVKYNNGGSVVHCTPAFLIGTSIRMSKMPQPGDTFGKKNSFLMGVPAKWIPLMTEINDFIMHEITKTTPIQRWDVALRRAVTEPNALMFMFGGANPDQLFKNFPQAKPWVKEFGGQIKKPKMDKWTEEEWSKFATFFRKMLCEADEGSKPEMKPLMMTPRDGEGEGRSMNITCKNMEMGHPLLDDDGRQKPQTKFTDKDNMAAGDVSPEVAMRQLTYDEQGTDGLPTRGGDVPVVTSISLWWYWVNDKGVNPTVHINTMLYQKPKMLQMSANTINLDKYAGLFEETQPPVRGDEEEDTEVAAAEAAAPATKRGRGGGATTARKTKARKVRHVDGSDDDDEIEEGEAGRGDDDFEGALDSDEDFE